MATFSSMAALKRAIQQEAKAAMKEAQTKMFKKTKEETQGYYSQGNPTIYERTGALGNSPQTTALQGSGDFLSFEVYLDEGTAYEVPNSAFTSRGFASYFTTPEIFEAAESGSYHTLGKSGFWKRSESEFQNILDSAMEHHFS